MNDHETARRLSPAAIRARRIRGWTADEVRALGVTTDLVTAGSILRIGRTRAFELAQAGQFPVPVICTGTRYVVPTAPLLALLGLVDTTQVAGGA